MKFKQILLVLFICAHLSCENTSKSKGGIFGNIAAEASAPSEIVAITLDNEKKVTDLLSAPDFQKLKADKLYVEYAEDYWDTNVSFNTKVFKQNKLTADMALLDKKVKTKNGDALEQSKKFTDLVKVAGKSVGTILTMGTDTYGLLTLDKKKKELYSSYSSEKKKIADQFEKLLSDMVIYSTAFPQNPNVKKNAVLVNYNSIGPSLMPDEEVTDYLESIIENMDQFLLKGVEVKSQIFLNEVLTPDYNSEVITIYGSAILNSSTTENFDLDSDLLEDYFKSLEKVLESIDKQNFDTPVEDWSQEKQDNFNFILSDVKVKLQKEINSLSVNAK